MDEDSEESIMEDRTGFTEVYSRKKNSKRKKSSKDQEDSGDLVVTTQGTIKKKEQSKSGKPKRTN